MVVKTNESEGKILKICIKIKFFLKSLEILFRVWKHIFGKNSLENQKFSENFRNIVESLETYLW